MAQPKQKNEAASTALDVELAQFLELKRKWKAIDKQWTAAKEALKHRGSDAGNQYAVCVKVTKTRPLKSKKELQTLIGDEVEKLCKDGERTNIDVFKLGEGA